MNSIKYPIGDPPELSFMPFLIGHLDMTQDTLIVGPESLFESSHDKFIEEFYSQIRITDLKEIALRSFIFMSKLCIGLILPTQLTDRGGRKGLFVTIGYLIDNKYLNYSYPNYIFVEFLKYILKAFNCFLSLSLPFEGSDTIIESLQNDNNDGYIKKLELVVDSLLISSSIFNSILKKNKLYRIVNIIKNIKGKTKIPKVILYPDNIKFDVILEIFVKEVIQGIKKLGNTGLQEIITGGNKFEIGHLLIMQSPKYIVNFEEIKIDKLREIKYIKIY